MSQALRSSERRAVPGSMSVSTRARRVAAARGALLGGVSLLTLLASAVPSKGGDILRGNRLASPVTIATTASTAASQQAAAVTQQSTDSLSRATLAIKAMQAGQNAARNLVLGTPSAVPNGLVPGGLVPDPGIASDPTLWQGAALPVQTTTASGQTDVSIQQLQPNAILNWQTFNVGASTVVDFIQSDANGVHSDWTALNRINDPSGRPSQILGQIQAAGAVYIINGNGIIFGGGAQVNVHALIASALDVGDIGATRFQRDQFFLNDGIAAAAAGHESFSYNPVPGGSPIGGDITVDSGATITTNVVAPDSPGFVYLFGPNVSNSGTITSPEGEVALVAASAVRLTPQVYDPIANGLPTPSAAFAAIRGTGFALTPYATPGTDSYEAGTGLVQNDGLIETPSGTTILNGDKIIMSGVISADTSINRNSSVFLDAVTSVEVSGVISAQPVEDGETLPLIASSAAQSSGSTVQTFVPASIELSAYDVTLDSNALIAAPGAAVSLAGRGVTPNFLFTPNVDQGSVPERVLLASGATIDVSGLQDVQLPASYNFVTFQPRGQEFADSPLQRDGALFGQSLTIDIRISGVRASDGFHWIGTPLADATGYVDQVTQSIDQLLTVGGTVSIKTDLGVKPGLSDVVLQPGSLINAQGGSVQFQPGFVATTLLLGADGHLYDISNADPNLQYVGIAGDFVVTHANSNLVETFANPLSGGTATFQPGYVEGHDAGGISISTVNPVLDGSFMFGAVIGARQAAAGLAPSGLANGVPAQASGNELPSQGYLSIVTPSSIVIGTQDGSTLPAGFTATTLLLPPTVPAANPSTIFTSKSAFQVDISADTLSGYGLSALTITANDVVVPAGSAVRLAPGGLLNVTAAGAIDIEGAMTAQGGQINLTTEGFGLNQLSSAFVGSTTASGHADIVVGAAGVLDASGRWVNDFGTNGSNLTGPGFINGGNIALTTDNDSSGLVDTTGNIVLVAGSLLDASSGGYVTSKGLLQTNASGLPTGQGGNISLQTYQGALFGDQNQSAGPVSPNSGAVAQLQIGGELQADSFSGGGTLTIAAANLVQIGGQPSSEPGALILPADYFANAGFGAYVLQAVTDGRADSAPQFTLAAGETMTLRQQNFSNTANYIGVGTGADIGQLAPLVTLSEDLRAPVNLRIVAQNALLDTGSSIVADASAKISVDDGILGSTTSPAASTLILGSITDHSGQVSIDSSLIWLGSQAHIDLSGTFIANSFFGQTKGVAQNGTLLPGGTISFENASVDANGTVGTSITGFVIAQNGASVDVSGVTGTLIGQNGLGPAADSAQVPSWSDAGTISFDTGTLLWDGTFKADAGAPQGNRGTLILGGSTVVLQQSNANVSGLVAEAANLFPPTSPTVLPQVMNALPSSFKNLDFASVDSMGGFDTVYLYAGVGGQKFFAATSSVDAADVLGGNLVISGNVNWSVTNRLYIESSAIVADAQAPGTSVLSAPYIMLASPLQPLPPPIGFQTGAVGSSLPGAGSAALTVQAQTIDIQSADLSGFAQASFISSGDIRLTTPTVVQGIPNTNGEGTFNPSTFFGEIVSAGNLSFSAERIYPVSAVDFEIVSTAPTGQIVFTAPSGSTANVPLSAGGSLTVSAASIAQNGNLFAPLGQIVLGAQTTADLSPNDPFVVSGTANYFVATNQVSLGPGSITSVSLGNNIVPFGQTEDGTNWFYNADTAPLAAPPAKAIRLLGQNVSVDASATIDLRGGGDLQAIEFVPGTGGSRDVLTTAAGSPTIYALLPSQQDPVAAFDIDFSASLGDAQPLAGSQVYLAGGNGVAAGFYTLYPAHYATLPGALRLVDYGNALAKPGQAGSTLPDGTEIISGYYTQSTLPGTRSSGTELFAVQTGAVWQQYSEIDTSTASSYFTATAAHAGLVTPPLPIDGGSLTLSALASLNLGAPALSQAAPGGRGGELDLSGGNIDLIGSAEQAVPAGFTGIDVAQLDASGFESILVGGRRTDEAAGTQITPTASTVLVDTHGIAFTAPEIILVAAAPTTTQTVAVGSSSATIVMPVLPADGSGTGNIIVTPGSIIEASGSTGASVGRQYLLGATAPSGSVTLAQLEQYTAAANAGLGALLLVSNDPTVSVTRLNAFPSTPVTVSVSGKNFFGQVTQLGTLTLPAASSSNIGFLSIGAGAEVSGGPKPGDGQSLILESTAPVAGISIDPQAVLGAHAITVTAGSIGIIGAGGNAPGTDGFVAAPTVLDQLTNASRLTLRTLGGAINFYGQVDFDTGNVLQNLTLDAPSLVGSGQDVTIGSGSNITLVNTHTGTTFPFSPVIGGTLTLEAPEIDLAGGNLNIAGFAGTGNMSGLVLNASSMVFAEGAGSIQVGANATPVDVTVTTPNFLVGAGTSSASGGQSQLTITTLGDFTLDRPAGAAIVPASTSQIGGNLQIVASSINDNGTIQILAGTLALHATGTKAASGVEQDGYNVTLGNDALIEAGGFQQSFADVIQYSSGGKVSLTADYGSVVTAASSVIDLSQPAGGLASGGELDVTATGNFQLPDGTVIIGSAELNGAIKAGGGPGLGGTFQLDTQGGVALDSLAGILGQGGVTGDINIHTHQGNLKLSQGSTLTANTVSLTADDASAGNGQVVVNGTINAAGFGGTTQDGSGEAGGDVSIYAHNAISIGSTGAIIASTTHTDERGGDIVLGIATGASGVIDLQSGSVVDVSGGTAGGLSGGTLLLRAPILIGQDDVAVGSLSSTITGARSVTVEAYQAVSTDGSIGVNGSSIGFDGIIDPAGLYQSNGELEPAGTLNAAHIKFYQYYLALFAEGELPGFTFNATQGRLSAGMAADVASVFHVQPGIELDNTNPNINNGNITVASNWNLAAGAVSNLATGTHANGTPYLYFDPATSSIQFAYRYGLEPGILTLRAVGDIDVNASISDGFFQFQNYADPTYQADLAHYTNRLTIGLNASTGAFAYNLNSAAAVPVAPYDPSANFVFGATNVADASTGANSASPIGTSTNPNPLGTADVFPSQLNVIDGSGGPTVQTAEGSWSYRITAGADFTSANPNAVGSLADQGSVVLNDHLTYTQSFQTTSAATVNVPTMMRTGTGGITVSAALDVILADPVAPGVIYTAGLNSAPLPSPDFTQQGTGTAATLIAQDPTGYLEPQLLSYGTLAKVQGPLTAAAFPEQGGDIDISAGRDIVGFQDVVSNGAPDYQFYAPWLISMAQISGSLNATTTAGPYGAGVFTPSGTTLAEQSSWWIEFGSFDQGVLSAGGNVTVTAGRDLRDFSVSLPSTGRVSGGLSQTDPVTGQLNTPVPNVYGSGNLVVHVGRNLDSGSFYEGSGYAQIVVGGAVGSDWTGQVGGTSSNPVTVPVATVLAVDSGQISLTAAGSVAISDIINPAELHAQSSPFTNGLGTVVFMDTYGPNSAVRLTSIGGDVAITSNLGLLNNSPLVFGNNAQIVVQTYPATLDVTALTGNITMPANGLVLTNSASGDFNLLAFGLLDLNGGAVPGVSSIPGEISAGAALIDAAFNAYEPNNGFDGATSSPLLAHSDDPSTDLVDHLIAVTGDITGGVPVEINRPVEVQAGHDIVDLNLTAQNIRATDVSSVIAGHDLYYTGLFNFGGLQIAGPGYFDVEAGRDLGPFLPAAFDTATAEEGIVSSGNSTKVPIGNDQQIIGLSNPEFTGQTGSGQRNFLLPDAGASIVAMFGVSNGIDYQAVVDKYINPANAAEAPQNYDGELVTFLAGLGVTAGTPDAAFALFQALSPQLQHMFVDQVYFAELQAVASPGVASGGNQFQRGYEMVNTLFPGSLGYTQNDLTGGANGSNLLVKTGDLNLLHATIQTQLGGDIRLFGPGGNILVGSTGIEPNPNLKLNNLGILTLAGGAIDTFTDESVLVNQSRIFTEQGGDILMWSSNGDLNAGRGAKTTTSLPPLAVNIDDNDFQTIDLGGLVSGAGIGVLEASDQATQSNAFLLAPRGTIDAGDAGIRSAGNLIVLAPIIANGSNISVGGTATGIPSAPTVNVAALSAASSTTAGATASADTQARSGTGSNNQPLPSIITVEVLGFGEPSADQKAGLGEPTEKKEERPQGR
jgi:filamentous hemagglutinin family protein